MTRPDGVAEAPSPAPPDEIPAEASSLARRAVRGSLWAAAGSYTTFAVNFIGIALLARRASPAEFGAYALAQSYSQTLAAIGTLPFGQAIVQCAREPRLADSAFVLDVVFRSALLLLSVPLAFAVASWNGGTVAWLFLLLGVLCVLDGMRSTMADTLQRDLRYRAISSANIVAAVTANTIAVVAGGLGLGSYALLLRDALLVTVVLGVFVAMARRWGLPSGRSFERGAAGRVWRFTRSLFSVRALEQVVARVDRIVLGNLLGTEGLGFFHQSKYLATLSTAAIAPANMHVAIATCSKVRHDRARLAQTFEILQYFVLRIAPLAGLAAVLFPEEILRTVYGARWLPGAPILRVLGIYATVVPVLETYRSVATAVEDWAPQRWSIAAQGVLLVTGLAILAPRYGAVGAAWATCLAPLAGFAVMVPAVGRRVGSSAHGSVGPVVVAVVVALGAGWGMQRLVGERGGLLLLAKLAGTAIAYLLCLALIEMGRIRRRVGYLRSAMT